MGPERRYCREDGLRVECSEPGGARTLQLASNRSGNDVEGFDWTAADTPPKAAPYPVLSTLGVQGFATVPAFDPSRKEYAVMVPNGFTGRLTIDPKHPDPTGGADGSGVRIRDALGDQDEDSSLPGFQVTPPAATSTGKTVAISVDAVERGTSAVYRLTVHRLPALTLELDRNSIAENGGTATVTARASGPLPAAFALRVAPHGYKPSGARVTTRLEAGDYTLSGDGMLRFAEGATASSGSVTITAVDNDSDNPDRLFFVIATNPGRLDDAPASPQSVPIDRFPVGSSSSTADALTATWHGREDMGGVHPLLIVDDDDTPAPSNFNLTATYGDDGSATVGWRHYGSYDGDVPSVTLAYRWGRKLGQVLGALLRVGWLAASPLRHDSGTRC